MSTEESGEEGDVSYKFFVPILPGYTNKLPLPHAFVNDTNLMKGNAASTATLRSTSGKWWHVNIYKDDEQEECFFGGKSWPKFVHAHNLGVGYFLFFTYHGNMVFSFRVYDLSSCETTSYIASTSKKDQDEEKIKTKKKMKKKPSKIKKEDLKPSNDRKKTHPDPSGTDTYRRRKRSYWTTGGGTCFEATMLPSNVSISYMNIPIGFADCNGLTKLKKVTLRDPKGRSWPVRLFHSRRQWGNSRDCSRFAVGWLQFVLGNTLKQGDRCNFQLVSKDNGKKVIHVKIKSM